MLHADFLAILGITCGGLDYFIAKVIRALSAVPGSFISFYHSLGFLGRPTLKRYISVQVGRNL